MRDGRTDRHLRYRPPFPYLEEAACRNSTVDFYAETKAGKRTAKAVCETCPVKKQCWQYAVDNQENWGIWGGVDFTRGCSDRKHGKCK